MSDEFEDKNGSYEDQEEVSRDSIILYEMIDAIEYEAREGSTLANRYDSFKYYFENLFGVEIDKIDDIENVISGNRTYIEIYTVIRDEIINIYDKYFGITFEDNEKVDLSRLYMIYQIVYLEYLRLLCMFAIGKGIEQNIDAKKLYLNATENNQKNAIDIADDLVGKYIVNEDEFTSENILSALEASDPGNEGYRYLFSGIYNEEVNSNVIINNEAFRRRIKMEYLHSGMKYLFELVYLSITGESHG
jgi:hypothetical protein